MSGRLHEVSTEKVQPRLPKGDVNKMLVVTSCQESTEEADEPMAFTNPMQMIQSIVEASIRAMLPHIAAARESK